MHGMRDRERKHCGRKWCHGRLINKTAFLSLVVGGVDCRRISGGRQVHPDQTKVVKG